MQVGVFQRKGGGKAEEGLGTSPMRLGRGAGKARTDGLGACWRSAILCGRSRILVAGGPLGVFLGDQAF
jgi:hypothetical protein